MPLSVLGSHYQPDRTDLVRLFHQTQAMWVQHLAAGEALEIGTAYASAELEGVWDANHVADAALPGGMAPEEALRLVESYFAGRGTRCFYWVLSPSAPPAQTGPLIEHLLSRGFETAEDDILYLRKIPAGATTGGAPGGSEPPAPSGTGGLGAQGAAGPGREAGAQGAAGPAQGAKGVKGGVQVIPARASYRHAEALARRAVTERWGGPQALVTARMMHLDDPHWDALLALKDGQAAATAGVLAVGEIGRIEHVYVAPEFRGRGIGRVMMGRALEICARSLFRHIFILVERDNAPAQRLYASLGFERIGQRTVYRAPLETDCRTGSAP